jgi:hypothetical protein
VYTTVAAAERLGGNAIGLAPWQEVTLALPAGGTISLTATPCRHGPPQADRGPVIGGLLRSGPDALDGIYISGDTVWYDGIAEVARRARVRTAILFLGAATVGAVGPFPLTFDAAGAVEAARAFTSARIVPLHFEGWAHFTESRAEVDAAFLTAGLAERLQWPVLGQGIPI